MPHTEKICSKARILVGLLYRQLYNNVNKDVMLKMYNSCQTPP